MLILCTLHLTPLCSWKGKVFFIFHPSTICSRLMDEWFFQGLYMYDVSVETSALYHSLNLLLLDPSKSICNPTILGLWNVKNGFSSLFRLEFLCELPKSLITAHLPPVLDKYTIDHTELKSALYKALELVFSRPLVQLEHFLSMYLRFYNLTFSHILFGVGGRGVKGWLIHEYVFETLLQILFLKTTVMGDQ